MGECVNVELVNAIFYGINKGIGEVMGEGGMVLGRRTSSAITEYLEKRGLLSKSTDIRKLFVDLGLSEDLIIEEKDKEVIFKVVKPTLKGFLEEIVKASVKPYICPFLGVTAQIYSEIKNVKLMLLDVKPHDEIVEIRFKKIQ